MSGAPWIPHRLAELSAAGRDVDQAKMAKAIGLSDDKLSKIIHGKRRIQSDELTRIAAYLDLTSDEIFRLTSKADTLTTNSNVAIGRDVRESRDGRAAPNFSDTLPLDVPVYGTAAAVVADQGAFTMESLWTYRP